MPPCQPRDKEGIAKWSVLLYKKLSYAIPRGSRNPQNVPWFELALPDETAREALRTRLLSLDEKSRQPGGSVDDQIHLIARPCKCS